VIQEFKPQATNGVWRLIGDYVVVALLVVWAAGGWIEMQLILGPSRQMAGVAAPIWVAIVAWVFLALHKAGRVRLSVSIASTLLVLGVIMWLGVGYA
jgi:hypothetical protein